MKNPIDPRKIKSDVPAGLFALEPLVPEDFRLLGADCLVEPRFLKGLLRNLGIDERHGMMSRQKLARDLLPAIDTAKTDIHANCVT